MICAMARVGVSCVGASAFDPNAKYRNLFLGQTFFAACKLSLIFPYRFFL
jgi:hypothetical protein